jgi:HSP20 family protein
MADRLSELLRSPAGSRSSWQKSAGPQDAFSESAAAMADPNHFQIPMETTTMLNTRSLGSSLDRMLTLNRALAEAFNGVTGSRVWVPALDVAERGDAYVIHAELPGVSPDQVDVSFEQNVLTIRGTKPASFDVATDGEVRVFAAERVHGSFERSVRLPEFVDAERIDANFTNGLLTVTVPKAQAAQPRKITIRGVSANGEQQKIQG